MNVKLAAAGMAAALMLAGCATTQQQASANASLDRILETQLSGRSQIAGGQLDAALTEAAQYPLGSDRNPVRSEGPGGQRAYLSRLRCPDGSAPDFVRNGNLGPGVFQNIVDAYAVTCGSKEPAIVVMDMYHPGYSEKQAVPGFTIIAR